MSEPILINQTKLQVAVFFGGCSPEYRISLASAAAVLEQLDTNRYTPVMIGISQDGQWFYYERFYSMRSIPFPDLQRIAVFLV